MAGAIFRGGAIAEGPPHTWSYTLTGDETNVTNIKTWLEGKGWTNELYIQIDMAGYDFGSTSTGNRALDIDGSHFTGTVPLTITITGNNGWIIGKEGAANNGAGGPAFRSQNTVSNSITVDLDLTGGGVSGGGGGGGRGATSGTAQTDVIGCGCGVPTGPCTGGNGGAGQGYGNQGGGSAGGSGNTVGGSPCTPCNCGDGGTGGAYGTAGGAGTSCDAGCNCTSCTAAQSGGAAGAAINGTGDVTWTSKGTVNGSDT